MVLLAEDHPINRRVICPQLDLIGFHVDTANDGQKAYELFTQERYGLVFTDLSMPVMDGFELAQAIRNRESSMGDGATPIVALSANVIAGEAEKCARAGIDDFLGKPAPMPALAEKLRRWLPHLDWPGDASPGSPHESDREVSPAGRDEHIDEAVLNELTDGDHDLAAAILVDYVESTKADLAALDAALADADADEVRRHAHRIKGASRTVGAHQVADLAARLEAAASTSVGEWQDLHATAESLELAVAGLAATLAAARTAG